MDDDDAAVPVDGDGATVEHTGGAVDVEDRREVAEQRAIEVRHTYAGEIIALIRLIAPYPVKATSDRISQAPDLPIRRYLPRHTTPESLIAGYGLSPSITRPLRQQSR